ncbi:MAG: thioredoxin domain-containing protein [Candidatus Heimdallarchaeota archaeon]
MSEENYENSLANETSPYLLQHKTNPVEWYAWDQGILKAKELKKPIFISIGYAACHWCHVMRHESFSDPDTAKIMNEYFINIKIDREERPDLDSYYQKALALLGTGGGWPLSVFATPNGEPFTGGTYFPKRSLYGRPSFRKVLQYVGKEYDENRDKVTDLVAKVHKAMRQQFEVTPQHSTQGKIDGILDRFVSRLMENFDNIFGGFGNQPKFPQVADLRFLLLSASQWRRNNQEILSAVTLSLDRMADGGIYDHLGAGFHRYSVDRKWLIPHFEKMLYDNGQLINLYLEGFQATGKGKYAEIVTEVINYLFRDMRHPGGAYYSSEDADSEGEEGRFYVWTGKEIRSILGKESGNKFCEYFGVKKGGNFEHGLSVLQATSELHKAEKEHDTKLEIQEMKEKLLSYRNRRERPFLNDNIILAWNALVIHALAKASYVLSNPDYLKKAKEASNFILSNLRNQETGLLYRTYREGQTKTEAFAEDYVLLIRALLEIFSVSGDYSFFKIANELQDILNANFWDKESFGYFFSAHDADAVGPREKPVVSFAVPSANAIALENLLKFYHFSGISSYLEQAEAQVEFLVGWAEDHGYLNGDALVALDSYRHKLLEITSFHNGEKDPSTSPEQYLRSIYLPPAVFLNITVKTLPKLRQLPLVGARIEAKEESDLFDGTIFICRDLTCSLPLKSLDEVDHYLSNELGK